MYFPGLQSGVKCDAYLGHCWSPDQQLNVYNYNRTLKPSNVNRIAMIRYAQP
jgi:hypothetical protein